MAISPPEKIQHTELKRCVTFPGMLGQSIASIGLTATVAVNIPVIYLSAAGGTWWTYLIATLAIVLVALSINQFARSSASSGGIATYVEQAMGTWAGIAASWALALAYIIVIMCVLAGFAESADVLFRGLHLIIPPVVYYAFCMVACTLLACWEVRFSTLLMLITEAISVSVIIILCVVVLSKHKFSVDLSLLTAHGDSFANIRSGLVLALLSFTAFESATTLGSESKEPLKMIPRAVIAAPIIAGVFFVFAAYVLSLAFAASPLPIAKSNDPLEMLAKQLGMDGFAVWIAFGASVCFFGAALAGTTAAARIVFSLAGSGLLPSKLAHVHPRFGTPHYALIAVGVVNVVVCMLMADFGCKPMDIFDYTGTVATFGFLLVYLMISIGAPIYLYRKGRLSVSAVVIALFSTGLLAFVAFSSIYPVPPAPLSYLPWIFLGLFAAGIIGFAVRLSVRR
ncbi:MAG: APC family permease [Chthoniobacterales bacterium]